MDRKGKHGTPKRINSVSKYDFGENNFTQEKPAGYISRDKCLTETMPAFSNMSVGVLIPARNEEKNIKDIVLKLRNLGYDNILVIDGKSSDATHRIAEINGAKVVPQNGLGKGDAVRQVLTERYFDVDVLVLMDADGSMCPEEIPVFIEALASGADIVKGSRFLKGGNTYDMSLTRRIGNGFMMVGVNILFSTRYTDLCYGYTVMNRRAVKALTPILQAKNFEIEAEMFIKAAELGLNVKEVPSVELKRKSGASNLNALRDGFAIFMTILREFISY